MLAKKQTLKGLTSNVLDAPKDLHLHYIFWDFDKGTLPELVKLLREIQKEFKLGDIFIYSDKKGSYRALCWSKRKWTDYVHILNHSFPYLDYGFWVWTIRRGAATLRTSQKADRPAQKIVQVLHGYESTALPTKIRDVTYDTGIEKEGMVIKLGSYA